MDVAFQRFLDLDATARLRLLADLAFHGTLDGRETYVPMDEGVEDGPALRRANEFVHRMISLMQHVLTQAPNTDAYAESLWTSLILPWSERRPGLLEAALHKAEG